MQDKNATEKVATPCPKCDYPMSWDFAGNEWCDHCGYPDYNEDEEF